MYLQATVPHDPTQPNEDWIGFQDGVLVLLDGAGLPSHWPTGCVHSVAWFVGQLGPALLQAAGDRNQSLTAALAQAITQTADRHRDSCELTHQNSPSATVVVVRLGADQVEGLVLADSTLLIATPSASGQPGASEAGIGAVQTFTDPTLERLRLSLREQDRSAELPTLRNVEGGFWAAQDDPAEADHALTFSWPRAELGMVAVLSDGAARAVDDFGDQTWQQVADQLARGELAAVLDRVRELELSDPDGDRWPRMKRHDDATIGVLLDLNGSL